MWSDIAKHCRHLLSLRRIAGAREPAEADAGPRTVRPSQAAGDDDRRRHGPPDDLTVIKGIGPVMRDRLRILGIATFADLAEADAGELTRWLRRHQPMSEATVQDWVRAARERIRA